MASVFGQSNAPNPLPIRSQLLWIDARSHGVTTSSIDNTAALQAAVDAAAAAVASALAVDPGTQKVATVFVPAAARPYIFRGPVYIDSPYVRVIGEGPGTRLVMYPGSGYPLFIFGLARAGLGGTANSSCRPDLFGVLDSTAASATGQKWGFRSGGNAFIFSQGSTLSHGGFSPTIGNQVADAWTETPALTIELALQGFASGQLPDGVYIGCGTTENGPMSPFTIRCTGNGGFRLWLSTQASRFATPVTNTYSFTSPSPSGVQRVAIQIDLVNSKVTAFVGGTQVAVSGGTDGHGGIPAGVALNQNLYDAFVVGQAPYFGMVPFGQTNPDFALYGLCLSRSIRYADRGAGAAQVAHPQCGGLGGGYLAFPGSPTGGTYRLSYKGQTTAPLAYNASAATVQAALQGLSTIGAGNVTVSAAGGSLLSFSAANGFAFVPGVTTSGITADGSLLTGQSIPDSYRYFPGLGADPNALAYLRFTESPSTAPRHLSVVGGHFAASDMASSAFLCNSDMYGAGNAAGSQPGNALEDLEIASGSGYGMGVMVAGGIQDATFRNVYFGGGGIYGCAAIPHASIYPLLFQRCRFAASDAPLFLYYSIARVTDAKFDIGGRSAIKAVASCVDVDTFFVRFSSPQAESACQFFGGSYGGVYAVRNATVDFEDRGFDRGAIYCERHPATFATQLVVCDMTFQLLADGPVVVLKDAGNRTDIGPGYCLVENCQGAPTSAVVSADGPGWVAEARNNAFLATPHLASAPTYGRPRVIVKDGSYRSLPRLGGAWFQGASLLEVAGPLDGQAATIRCSKDGVFGSASPPTWVGSNAVQSSPAALAGHAIGHTAIAATLSGQVSAWGTLTDRGAALLAGNLAGSATAPPSTYYVGLSTIGANRQGRVAEPPSGVGYARVQVANNPTNFPAASGGSKATGAAITFPTATASWGAIKSIFLADASGYVYAVVQLASPLTVNAGSAPSISSGGLTFANAPLPGSWGLATDYGWGKGYDLLFGGVTFSAPSFYAGLATSAPARTGTPSEPSGNGYARVALALTAVGQPAQQFGDVTNSASIAFPTPTGAWGNLVAAPIFDASTGGNVWAVGSLAVPTAPTTGSPAPTFAPSALTLAMS